MNGIPTRRRIATTALAPAILGLLACSTPVAKVAAPVSAAAPAPVAGAARGGVFGVPMCVVSIDRDAGMVTFVPPDATTPGEAVALPFRAIAGFAPGDLVTLSPATDAKVGPGVAVKSAGAGECSRFVAAAKHHHGSHH